MRVARVTIACRYEAGAPLHREHYLPRHLPLAVGTSMRHATITTCHCDCPVPGSTPPPYVCLCVVEFESPAAMDDFRGFFATGHPESERMIADEQNYTTSAPQFMAGIAERRMVAGAGGHAMSVQPTIPAEQRPWRKD